MIILIFGSIGAIKFYSTKLNSQICGIMKTVGELGSYLSFLKTICKEKKLPFYVTLSKICQLKDRHHINFYIKVYKLFSDYPKLHDLSVSITFFKNNFKDIENEVSTDEAFWKNY